MVYKRFALIAALLAILASACGTSQESESPAPPGGVTTFQTPTAVPTPELTSSPTPAAVVELPLGESSKQVVDLFISDPVTVARAVLAASFDTSASDPILDPWVNRLKPVIAVSPTIYRIYTWANYPVGTYPHVEQFILEFLKYPQGYGHAAEQWLDSDPCTWPEEVQEQVVAVERQSPGRLRASVTSAIHPAWMAEPAIRAITIEARGQFFDDREAYLGKFRCTSEGGGTADRTRIAWPTAAAQAATVASTPTPTRVSAANPTPAVEILETPLQPGLPRELVVSYLAEKVGQGTASRNVQNRADRLAYLTESAPWALDMYIKAGYRIPVADEQDFYAMYLFIPACVVSHPVLSERQVATFTTEFNRHWPDVNPRTMPGLAAIEEMTESQQGELCTLFSTAIETTKPD